MWDWKGWGGVVEWVGVGEDWYIGKWMNDDSLGIGRSCEDCGGLFE